MPSITTEQMREVDRLMIEEYGIVLLQMMENAGRNLARLAATLAAGARDRSVLVLAGKGNNGGGGMVAARHLSNMGGRVRVILPVAVRELADVPAHQASILQRMGVELLEAEDVPQTRLERLFSEADLIVDALIGYSLTGAPRGRFAALIDGANAGGKPIVSLDVPSGVDAGSGTVYEPSIKAVATLTRPDLVGTVRIGIPDDYVMRFLPGILTRFAQAYPRVQVDVQCEPSHKLTRHLQSRRLDLGLITCGPGEETGEVLRREPVVWATSERHFAHEEDPLPLALFQKGCFVRDSVMKLLDEAGRSYRVAYSSPSLTGIHAAVSAGLAVTAIACSIVPDNNWI
ncbi:MAG: NAD(P)H-hydrate epimerase [Chloroflexi bacterium]|nr:NAD(P)H-hydrate epimerase [Chloroflexota bacterium]